MLDVYRGPTIMPIKRRPISILPVKRGRFVQKGMGHCSHRDHRGHRCNCSFRQTGQRTGQRGGNIFDAIASGFEEAFSDPLRGIAAVATGGISEAAIRSGQAFEKTTGIKPSKAIDIAMVPAAMFAPEIALPGAAVSAGYKLIGMGKKKRLNKSNRTNKSNKRSKKKVKRVK